MNTYIIQAASTRESLESDGAVIEGTCETLRAAHKRARYYVTDIFASRAELSSTLGYARVILNGENIFDVGE